jgi:TatD DNase family protein
MGWIDAHCHLDLPPLNQDLSKTITWLRSHHIKEWILGGCHPQTWSTHAQVAHLHTGVQWTIGHHPIYVVEQGWDPKSLDQMMHWLKAPMDQLSVPSRPCGFGELGLDLRAVYSPYLDEQWRALRDQWALVRQYSYPVVLHVVRAHSYLFDLFKQDGGPPAGGIVHAFNGSLEEANRYLKWGIFPSIGSQILNPKARKLRKTLYSLEPSQWVIETDSPDQPPKEMESQEYPPYLSPGPFHTSLSLYRIAFEIGWIREGESPIKPKYEWATLKNHPLTLKYLTQSKALLKQIFPT